MIDKNQLAGKVALVTGASRGLGRGIALGLADQGCNLVLAARDGEKLARVAEEAQSRGVEVAARATDVTQEREIEALFELLVERFGRLDLLVNNAGAFDGGPLDALSTEAWDHVLAVNLRAPFLCTRAALAIMKRQRSGRIINIGSISAQRVRPQSAPYSASKHGLWGLTQVTALEGREYGVTCGCIHPGNVRVERRVESVAVEDQEPMMEIEEVVPAVLLIASLPPHVEMLEAKILPRDQLYVGRG
jgi:NAD(P)-dependent dehydrogenase (short-subunit alcohol dehydrogenase family)